MIDEYLNYIHEGYLLSDTTISIDLEKFERGKIKKLLIVGPSGSGKSTLGEFLSKKYKSSYIDTDSFHGNKQKFISHIKSNKREIIEGMYTVELYLKDDTVKRILSNLPIILLGDSALKSIINSMERAKRGRWSWWEDVKTTYKTNVVNGFIKDYKRFRTDRIKRGNVKKYIPSKFDLITFPREEWDDIKERLGRNEIVHSIRVDRDYDKFKKGKFYITEWGRLIEITSIEKLSSIDDYYYYNELNSAQKNDLKKYNKLDHISFRYTTKQKILPDFEDIDWSKF